MKNAILIMLVAACVAGFVIVAFDQQGATENEIMIKTLTNKIGSLQEDLAALNKRVVEAQAQAIEAQTKAANTLHVAAPVNVRVGPGVDYMIVTTLEAGDKVIRMNDKIKKSYGYQWVEVHTSFGDGWAAKRYFKEAK